MFYDKQSVCLLWQNGKHTTIRNRTEMTAKYYHLKLSVATVKRFRTRNVASTSATCQISHTPCYTNFCHTTTNSHAALNYLRSSWSSLSRYIQQSRHSQIVLAINNHTRSKVSVITRSITERHSQFPLSVVATTVLFSSSVFFSVTAITHEPLNLAPWNFAGIRILTTARNPENFKVIGQRSRSQNRIFGFFCHCKIGQKSLWPR